jgi:hypothetical protein
MRTLTRALVASLLVLAPASCKRTGESSTAGPAKVAKPTRKPGMPAPLRLPANPEAAVHVDNPRVALAQLSAYAPIDTGPRELLAQALAQSNTGFEKQLVQHVALARPWDFAIVQGQTILHVPLQPKSVGAVANMLSSLPPEGKFGAVRLRRGPEDPGPKLAYLDRSTSTITLADDLRGIVTGPELARAYGKKGLYVTVTRAQAAKYGLELPAESVVIEGSGIDDFALEAKGFNETVPGMDKIADGALTGMLESPNVALGFSTKYAAYKQDVNKIIGDASRQVSKQNFLVRGTLEEMLARFKAMARAWNGRVMVGVGPRRHVLLGVGSDDAKFGTKTLYFISGLLGNLKTADAFGIGGLPDIRFARSKDVGAGSNIHIIALENARKHVPPQYHALLNDRGDLRVAFAFPSRMGGAMLAIGPDCQSVLKRWLEDTARATPGDKTRDHFVAATVAVAPGSIQKVLADQTGAAAFELTANAKPTRFVVRRQEGTVKLDVSGPKRSS